MKGLYFFLNVLLLVALMNFSAGCQDSNTDGPNPPVDPDSPVELTRVELPTAVIGGFPAGDLGEALAYRFPIVSELNSSDIAIFSGSTLKSAPVASLKEFYDRGGLVLVVNPDSDTDEVLENDLGAGYSPYCDQTNVLVYAFNKFDSHLMIFEDEELPREETDIEETDISGLVGIPDSGEPLDDSDTIDEDEAEAHEHGLNYYQCRLESLVNWIYDNLPDSSANEVESTRSEDGYDSKYNINLGVISLNASFPVKLHNKIDKATGSKPDYLDKDGDVSVNLEIHPLYIHNIPGQTEAQAGDYYFVTSTVTMHNRDLWDPKKFQHGGCNNRVIGYYMRQANVLFELMDKNNIDKLKKSSDWLRIAVSDQIPPNSEDHLSGVSFYGSTPIPNTYQGSTTYSESTNFGFEVTLSGKANTDKGAEVALEAGFSASWSKSFSQTLPDVVIQKNTDGSARVGYQYNIQNIRNQRKWGDWEKRYPSLCRADLTGTSFWIWRIPYGQHGVEENSNAKFFIKASFKGFYETFNWWRGASWDRTKQFHSDLGVAAFEIAPPSRRPFGVLALKNAADETIANIRMTNRSTGKEAFIPGSYSYNEIARIKLETGTYHLEYDVLDAKTHKILSTWYMNDVKIKMGVNEQASTTLVSTVNFDRK